MSDIKRAMNLDKALALAKDLGCEVRVPRRTGEYVVTSAILGERVRGNLRKKDAPPQLITLLRKLEAMPR